MNSHFLTPEALASRWNLTPNTFSQWRWNGRGPPFLKIGHRVYIDWKILKNLKKPSFAITRAKISEKQFLLLTSNTKRGLPMNSLLLPHNPWLQVQPSLAYKIGLNEAIILQQVLYWLNPQFNENFFEGRYWVWNTYDQWQSQFPFWGMNTS